MVQKKLAFVFSLVLIMIFSLGVVSATINRDCGGKLENALFKVSGTTNAHAELFSETNYDYYVCFDEYEGTNISNGTITYARLSGPSNAHIANALDTNYLTLLQHADDANCSIASQAECDDAGKTVVASVSGLSNAHVGENITYSQGKICCKNTCTITEPDGEVTCGDGLDNDCNGFADCADPNCAANNETCLAPCVLNDGNWSTFWMNSSQDETSTAEEGDSVRLIVDYDSLDSSSCTGKEVQFKILETDCVDTLLFGEVCTYDDVVVTQPSKFELSTIRINPSGGNWIAEWHDDIGGITSNSEYVFTACLVTNTSNCINSDVNDFIVTPHCGNGVCDVSKGETTANCVEDCPPSATCTTSTCPTTTTYTCLSGEISRESINTQYCTPPDGPCLDSITNNDNTCGVGNYENEPRCVANLNRCVECTVATQTDDCASNLCSDNVCVECKDKGDCTDDGNDCTTKTCNTGTGLCEYPSVPDGDPCEGNLGSCSSGVCNLDIYWADMRGNYMTDAKAEVGDSLLMIYEQPGAYVPLTYDVYELDPYPLQDDELGIGIESFDFNGNTSSIWKITRDDFNSANDALELLNGHEEFQFRIDEANKKSNELKVSESIFNTPPIAIIDNPTDCLAYTLNYKVDNHTEDITFSQSSYDVDDDIKVQWIFGDGQESAWQENCLTTENCGSVMHNYSTPGTKGVVLIAREMDVSRGQWGWDSRNILVYGEGLQVFSIIGSPFVRGRFVKLNASNSKVVNCTSGSKPGDEWKLVKDDCSTEDHPLWCYEFPKPGELGADYDFLLRWTLDENDPDKKKVINGSWSSDYDDVVEFTNLFPDLGVHTVKLEVGYIKL